jgi:RNA polymerase sigma-70 factor (ECF subfamily)
MYRTAVSAALDVIRSRRERANEQIDTSRESGEMRLGSLPGPDVELEHSELGAIVSRAVEEVTPSRRPVLRMYLAGYDREEIAALLGWSEAKTRNLLYRGLADLRELLSERGIGPEVTR